MKIEEETRVFGGVLFRCMHKSESLGGLEASFAVFLPSPAVEDFRNKGRRSKWNVVYYLSGLTCTRENVITKAANGFRTAEKENLVIVICDTSPRGANCAGEDDKMHIGTGAGFYVDADKSPWRKNYRMYSYVTEDLPKVVQDYFVDIQKCSIMGHSMGGHGAMMISLKNPTKYVSVSCFAPVCRPSKAQWGQEAFETYFESKERWRDFDSYELLQNISKEGKVNELPHLLVDQGLEDTFLEDALRTSELLKLCKDIKHPRHTFRNHTGYDHSHHFVASFIEEHLVWHSQHMNAL